MGRPAAWGLACCLLALGACGDGDSRPTPDRFDADRAFADIEAQVEIGPRPAGSAGASRTRELIRDRLAAAGVERVTTQRGHANVVGFLPGSDSDIVVLGAHYDTKTGVPGFVGANDNASGVAVLLELARSLPRPLPGPGAVLAFFDAEESRGDRPFEVDGMRGSRQYVEIARDGGGQGSPPLDRIRAMVLFDLVGDCDLEIPREDISDAALYELFAAAAREVDGDPAPFTGRRSAILDDHVPFVQELVPAVDLIDFDFGPGPSPGAWWHTREDTVDKLCSESLDAVGEAAVVAVPRIR